MAETLDLDFERQVFWPTDERLARAIENKSTEYADRLRKIFGPNIHPVATIMLGLSQEIESGLVYQARIDFIKELKEKGEAGLAPATFANKFVATLESVLSTQPNEDSHQAFLNKVMYEASVVREYCEGRGSLLIGGTGLHFDDQPAENTL